MGVPYVLGKKSFFLEYIWEKADDIVKVRITNKSIMVQKEIIPNLEVKWA